MFSKEAEEKCLIGRHGTIQWQNLLQFLKLCEKETNREQCKEGLKDFNTFNKTKYNPSKSVSYVSHSLNEAEQFLSLMQKKEANVLGFADVTALPIFNTVNRNVHTFPTLREYEIFYYSWYFGWNLLNESDARKIYHVVLNYCKALQWTFSYYYSGVTDWYWSYPYRYPPLFSSLLKVVPALSKLPLTLTPNVYSCSSQLLALLPYTSANILPETYQKFFLSERLTKFSNVNNLLSVRFSFHCVCVLSFLPVLSNFLAML
jgi:5'-3' exonuclease